MRILSLTIFILTMAVSTFAQGIPYIPKDTGENRLKEVSGRYGSNEGICLFDDDRFLLYGYATAVFGFYKFKFFTSCDDVEKSYHDKNDAE
ncbi:hypothetical protein [Sphingobacterium faecium]|uniref:hypothetical protein n=1 Tax=Sphingobacterium faecium TaxID=34087 RepID=UPI003208B68A